GLDANTVIMVLADHGDMLGERGLWYKMSFFENACRIPLIVHAPERFVAHRVSEPASLLDILPTLVDLASEGEALAYAAPIDGRSLLPALEGGAGPGQVVGEYLAEGAVAALVGTTARAAAVSEPAGCRAVRLADVGWTDVTATTAVLSALLRDLGYDAHTTLLSVPVTFASMKRGNIDVFLGNWMPAQTNDRRPYLEERSIEVVRENLSGAKYTLAVPAYTYAAGLRDFADIQRFGAALHHTIYGIEAGNDGNRHILRMIQNNDFGLGDIRLVESSEQGMHGYVAMVYAAHAPIVFLAWDPHPMNIQFDLRYLA